MLIQPTTRTIDGKEFIISKLPAITAIEIQMRGGAAILPLRGVQDFATVQEMLIKTMAYVAIKHPSLGELALNSKELIDNHCPDWRTCLKVLDEMSEYNNFFFLDGKPSTFLKEHIAAPLTKIIGTLSQLSQSSLQADLPHFTN